MDNIMNGNSESVLQERVNRLKDEGYRGFTVISAKKSDEWDGVKVTVKNSKGKELNAVGETVDEAYENAIEIIDIATDDK